jgi:hypothetical protein
MNKLNTSERAQVIRWLVDGNSIRATERITGVTKKAIIRLLVQVGEACRKYQNARLRNLRCARIQVDEICSFCGAKEKNASAATKAQGWGEVWTAIDADTKLIASWKVGDRTDPALRRGIHAGFGFTPFTSRANHERWEPRLFDCCR